MRNTGQKTILLALAALLALLIAGCGGGDETESTTTPTVEEPAALTKDELITQGDAICAEVNAAVGALTSSEETEESATEGSEKVANLYTGMVERLQDLGEPAEDPTEYAAFEEATAELGQIEADLKLAAEREDVATVEEKGQEAAAALEEFQSQAATYGFEDCSAEPGTLTPAGGGEATPGGEEFEGGEEEGGVEVEPEFEEAAPEEEIVPEEEVAPETGGAGGSPEAPAPEPESGGESGGVGPG
ncbi:MAG: hypothetical protein E6G51_05070 [Actinobacteria bacterium]|nr:MAG: hypothetical protein E6G51_05070 [Actinomycetota bacterium]